MARKPLNPGELGTPSLTRVTKQPNGKYAADPKGKYWEARIRIGQTTGQPRLVRRVAATKQQALDKAVNSAHEYTQIGATPLAAQTSLNKLWKILLSTQDWADAAESTKRIYECARRHSKQLAPQLWKKPLTETLRPHLWDAHFDELTQQCGSAVAAQAKAAVLRALKPYRREIDIQAISGAHVTKGKRVRETKTDLERIFTEEEFSHLREHLEKSINPDTKKGQTAALLLVNTYLGIRRSELLSLGPGNLNEDWTILTVYSQKTKRDYPEKAIPPWVADTLHRLPVQDGKFSAVGPVVFSVAARKLLNEAGYEWATPHTIRRTVGSRVFDLKGVRAASEWLAHSTVATTIAYYVKVKGAAGGDVLDF